MTGWRRLPAQTISSCGSPLATTPRIAGSERAPAPQDRIEWTFGVKHEAQVDACKSMPVPPL